MKLFRFRRHSCAEVPHDYSMPHAFPRQAKQGRQGVFGSASSRSRSIQFHQVELRHFTILTSKCIGGQAGIFVGEVLAGLFTTPIS